MSEVLDKAITLLQMDPLPDDAEQQLLALQEKANDFEEIAFAEIWEGFFMRTQNFGDNALPK